MCYVKWLLSSSLLLVLFSLSLSPSLFHALCVMDDHRAKYTLNKCIKAYFSENSTKTHIFIIENDTEKNIPEQERGKKKSVHEIFILFCRSVGRFKSKMAKKLNEPKYQSELHTKKWNILHQHQLKIYIHGVELLRGLC